MSNPLKALGNLNELRKQAKKMQQELSAEEIKIEEGNVILFSEVKIFSIFINNYLII